MPALSFGTFKAEHYQDIGLSGGLTGLILPIGFALYFCKDCLSGRSIAKRLLGQQVINYKTGEIANPLRCFVRNFFCILWPLEIFVVLFSPSRRIGDFVAGTAVVKSDPERLANVNLKQALIAFLIAYGLAYGFAKIFTGFINKSRVVPIESSYNKNLSNQLERIYTDSLNYCVDTCSIKTYDRIYGSNKRHVSIIIWLKSNCSINDLDGLHQFNEEVKRFLFKESPKATTKAQIKYVYQTKTSFNMQIFNVD